MALAPAGVFGAASQGLFAHPLAGLHPQFSIRKPFLLTSQTRFPLGPPREGPTLGFERFRRTPKTVPPPIALDA